MIRPLVFAIIEYILAYIVFKNGKIQKNVFALVLFFLATYQLGEVVIFLTQGDVAGFRIAYTATTLLPPLGVLLVERLTKKHYGYRIFQMIGLGFVGYILLTSQIALSFGFGPYCVRVYEYDSVMSTYWQYYYQLTLLYTIGILVWEIIKNKSDETSQILKRVLISYVSFNFLGILITRLIPDMGYSMTSLICALALIAAVIFTRTSLNLTFDEIVQKIREKITLLTKNRWTNYSQ